MPMTQHTDLPSDLLPATVRGFMAAHIARDAGLSSYLAEDVVVVDQGETVRGPSNA